MAKDESTDGKRLALDTMIDAQLPAVSPGRTRDPAELEEPEAPPEPRPAPAPEPAPPPAAARADTPAKKEAEPPEPAAKPDEKRITYKGQQFSVDEFIKTGQLDNLLTTADKYTELQRAHTELKKQTEAPSAETEAPKPLTQADIRREFDPMVQQAADAGYLSKDFVTDWPDEAAQLVFHRELLYEARARVQRLEQIVAQFLHEGRKQQWHSYVVGLFDELAKRTDENMPEGFFTTLNNEGMRDKFFEYLVQLSPTQEQLSAENVLDFLATQYVAFNARAYAEAVKIARREGPATNGTDRQRAKAEAAGESQGARPGAPDTKAEEPKRRGIALDKVIDAELPQ